MITVDLYNVVVFSNTIEIDDLFLELNSIFKDSNMYEHNLTLIATKSLEQKQLSQLLEFAAKLFGNLLFIIDASAKTVIHAGTENIDPNTDEGISNSLNKGFVSYDFLQKADLAVILHRVSASQKPIILENGYGLKYRRMIMRVPNARNEYEHFLTLIELNHKFG